MSNNIDDLAVDYRLFDLQSSEYSFSNRILSPTLEIDKIGGRYRASLGAQVVKGGKEKFIACLSNLHNWISDGNRIRPLPHDAPVFVNDALGEMDPNDLSYPDVLALMRKGIEGVDIRVTSDVTEAANAKARSMSLPWVPVDLNASLYPYQEQGVAWLNDALDSFGGAVLADEMGLGKTLQIITLFLLKKPSADKPALIVCPTTLIANWCREIGKFAPRLSYLVHRGADRAGYHKELMRFEVVITTYDTLVNDITIFRGVDWTYLICDEAQAVKNPDSKRRKNLSYLSRRYAIPVTGTPVENSLMDLWSLSDLAIPGILGSRDDFAASYPDSEEGAAELSSVSDTIVLKRTVKDVAGDLPERRDIDLPLELDDQAVKDYEKIREETVAEYGVAGMLVAVGQLALYCAHPRLRTKRPKTEHWEDSVEIDASSAYPLITPKMELCLQILRESMLTGKKVLVFAAFNHCGDLIKEAVDRENLAFSYWNNINGSTSQEDRQHIVDAFSEVDGPAVLILNPKAAGSGLNITAATIVVHYTQNWNPALEMQASARAHRRGQQLPVTVYRLYYQGTVEETMVERSLWKRELGDAAVPISVRDREDLEKALSVSPQHSRDGNV